MKCQSLKGKYMTKSQTQTKPEFKCMFCKRKFNTAVERMEHIRDGKYDGSRCQALGHVRFTMERIKNQCILSI